MKATLATLATATLAAGILLAVAACNDRAEEPEGENPALAVPVPEGMIRGTVLETMDAASYTYVLLDTAEGQRWVAAKQTPVAVGDVVQTNHGMAMQNFTSRSLNRTFEVIYFSGALQNLSATTPPAGHPATALPTGHPTTTAAPVAAGTTVADLAVDPVEEGKDIAWVYANKDSLEGQPVSLRGKVVKSNANILGTNWLHIQDGSGSASDGSNNLVVTSAAEAAIGDTVVVAGNIVLERDFGAGYSYPVLLEDASLTVE
ncbi:MAG: nucleotide-binding protein [Gammaproteobacteria bacterium]|nr:nucleotide-binding protein [Gammaproteobacteria bacterium]NNL50548.1 nucleotide-binding protein [Woeseiaceae bacterium]